MEYIYPVVIPVKAGIQDSGAENVEFDAIYYV